MNLRAEPRITYGSPATARIPLRFGEIGVEEESIGSPDDGTGVSIIPDRVSERMILNHADKLKWGEFRRAKAKELLTKDCGRRRARRCARQRTRQAIADEARAKVAEALPFT
jgi:hypothetical protein